MSEITDWAQIVGNIGKKQYADRIEYLKGKNYNTDAIEKTIDNTMRSFKNDQNRSFVIFGEPQCGKTEMMIALNARLLDEGVNIIINLLNDSIELLQQNSSRFSKANLNPSPRQIPELPSDIASITGKKWVIISKKNARDLEKLVESLKNVNNLVIIDDEADFASPNSKINRGERTKINQLIQTLLADRGKYIGVTATPARLDLNNTFGNKTEFWVNFESHPLYIGQDFFFPTDGNISYRLHTFNPSSVDEREILIKSILHFLCGVAEQHRMGNKKNFTMLVHTSSKTSEHTADYQIVDDTINILSNVTHELFNKYKNLLIDISKEYDAHDPLSIVRFVLENINRNRIIKLNSRNNNLDISDISDPQSLFTFGIGGNKISRGVTFDNLLSMYFTRDVKGKMAQDTYIQRARMFGNRDKYKQFFQLWITEALMEDWCKCFIFHKLAIQSALSEMGPPVWLSDYKNIPTALSSVDKSSVDFYDGEMSFDIFDFDSTKEIMGTKNMTNKERMEAIRKNLPDNCFPLYVMEYILSDAASEEEICFHKPSQFGEKSKNYKVEEIEKIRRTKGVFSYQEFKRGDRPCARHHLKIFYNSHGKARIFYKINGSSIRFLQNKRDN
jgi:hypothetical protein